MFRRRFRGRWPCTNVGRPQREAYILGAAESKWEEEETPWQHGGFRGPVLQRNSWSWGTCGCLHSQYIYIAYIAHLSLRTSWKWKMAHLCFKVAFSEKALLHRYPTWSQHGLLLSFRDELRAQMLTVMVAQLDCQDPQLWQRRCFSHEELNRREMRGSDELVQGFRRPKSFFGRADLLVCYDCWCRCSRDTTGWGVKETSWWSHDWPVNGLCGLQFRRYTFPWTIT